MSKPHINVTPLIDVLLVLLIIFMVVSPLKPHAFEAKIPSEPEKGIESPPLALVVLVGGDSGLTLNRQVLGATVDDPAPLVERLSAIFEARKRNMVFTDNTGGESTLMIEKTVFIKAPRGIEYGRVARVIDAVKTSGANPVSLQIDDLE